MCIFPLVFFLIFENRTIITERYFLLKQSPSTSNKSLGFQAGHCSKLPAAKIFDTVPKLSKTCW